MIIPLPVRPDATTIATRWNLELQRLIRGQVHVDDHHRLLYSTDASIYQSCPLGVVVPATIDDVLNTVKFCRDHALPILPRGGGTSLAGQAVNRAVVIDLSPAFRRILHLDEPGRRCTVEPGISIDELNRQLRSRGLFFAPDPATTAQASIGGCIGNNAAGARSIKYGRTSENVSGLEVLLSTGERCNLSPGAGQRCPIARRLAEQVAQVVINHANLIRARFPKTIRRNAGYGLDLICNQLDRGTLPSDLDLSGLICGSEGTLGLVLAATLVLQPIPAASRLALVSFATLEDAIAVVPDIVASGASAVELLDHIVLEAAAQNTACRRYLRLIADLPTGRPQAVLYVEYQATNGPQELSARFDRLGDIVGDAPIARLSTPETAQAWDLRKASEALLHAHGGERKPQTFVEDNAIPLDRLLEFVASFKEIVARHGTSAAYYAHASVGVLHVRPMINLHDEADRRRLRSIAVEVADLAQRCGGVMSGEHGDGRVRGPLLERFFGPELTAAFAQIKRIFDPAGLLNPTMIVGAGPIESITENLREEAESARGEQSGSPFDTPTFYQYDDAGGQDFRGAVERCNGAGFCRKTAGGTMCPSYRATLDERHSTRGRGNALRLAISGQLGGGGAASPWDDPDVIETLDLCLSCKACKSECPSNVDLARLKAEYTGQRYRRIGAPLAARAFGHIRALNRLGSIVPELSNSLMTQPYVKGLLASLLRVDPRRTLPAFARPLHDDFRASNQSKLPRVALLADCFTAFNDPHIGLAARRLFSALGYHVDLLDAGCCGRAMISNGLLTEAATTIDRTLNRLADAATDPAVKAIIVCEPSCLSAMRDDWLHLKLSTPLDLRQKVAAKAFAPEDFLEQRWSDHPRQCSFAPEPGQVLVHGHCHQKALWGESSMTAALRRACGQNLTVLPTGCCGMAGAFGYEVGKYELSMRIGELSLFGPLRDAPQATIVAPGTSCRHQIHDALSRHALHPIELLAERLSC